MSNKNYVLKLLTVIPAVLICLVLLVMPVVAVDPPMPIYGYLTINGQPTGGIWITDGISNTYSQSDGYYQLTPSVRNGSPITITADCNGNKFSQTLVQNIAQGRFRLDIPLVFTPTPTPLKSFDNSFYITTPTPVPTASQGSTATVTAISGTPTPNPSEKSSASATPAPSAIGPGGNTLFTFGGLQYFIVVLIIVILVIIILYMQRKAKGKQ